MQGQIKQLSLICLLVLGLTSGAAASQPKVFVFRMSGRPDGLLDPLKCFNARCRRVMWAIYENLGKLSEDSKDLLPALAESWEASPDGLSYTLRLRTGVRFHDGTPFNAEAVKINLERYSSHPPDYIGLPAITLAHLVNEVTVDDEHTLTVSLKHENVDPLLRVPMVSPTALEKDGETYGKHPVGTGPFRFVRWTADQVRVTANSDYWDGRPKLDQISFRIITDGKTKIREFFAGRLDFIPFVGFSSMDRVRDNPATRFMRVPAMNVCYLVTYVHRKPFHDRRVRMALARAIDIERVNRLLGRGRATPAHGVIPPGGDGYDPDLKRPEYNPDEAKRLLREAGYPSGFQFSLLYPSGSGDMSSVAHAIKTDLKRIGVDVDLVGLKTYPKLLAKIKEGVGDAFFKCAQLRSPRLEDSLLGFFRRSTYSRYNNAKVHDLLDQALRVKDLSARISLYSEVHRIVLEDAVIIPFFHRVRLAGYNARVTGLRLNSEALPRDRFLGVDIRQE